MEPIDRRIANALEWLLAAGTVAERAAVLHGEKESLRYVIL